MPPRWSKRGSGASPPGQRDVQSREVFLLDELGRFVAGATAAGVPVAEGMLPRGVLEAARAVVAARAVPPGTFEARAGGEAVIVVSGGSEFFACCAEDAVAKHEVPHELAAVATAFEAHAADEIRAGGLSRASIAAFPQVARAALLDPGRFAPAPATPTAFARAAFRPSGARLALDIEVVNETPWEAERVEVRLAYDASALPLASVKARSGGFKDGVLELPSVAARSRDRAVLLFEPHAAGVHLVEGELTLGLGGERRHVSRMRRARAAIAPARVVPTVPKTLAEFEKLIGARLRHAALVVLPETLGGLATVAGVGTEIERDDFAKILDWYGPGGTREVWYLGVGASPERPLLVQVTQGAKDTAEVVVAAGAVQDLLAYSASLRARFGGEGPGARGAAAPADVVADLTPEVVEPVLHPALVAKQISAELALGEIDSRVRRPRALAAPGTAAVMGASRGRSAGDELVPGLIEALERAVVSEAWGSGPRAPRI